MTRVLSLAFALAATASPQALIQGIVETIENDQRLPVVDAVVRAFVDDEAIAVARSGRDGLYSVGVPAEIFELRLDKPGYVVATAAGLNVPRLQRTCPEAGDCGQVDFLLERAAAVEVWLADPSGDPFPGPYVTLTSIDDGASKRGELDDRGIARFYGLSTTRYQVEVVVRRVFPGIGSVYEVDATEIDLRPGDNPPVHLSARRSDGETYALSGLIEGVEFESAARYLQVRRLDNGRRWSTRQQGPQLNFSRLPKGEYVLEMRSRGGDPTVLLGRIRLDADRTGLVLRPARLPTLIGRVWFEDDTPDFGRFELRSEEGWTWSRVRVSRSSPRLRIEDAPPGRYTLVNATPDAFLLDEPTILLTEGGVERVELTLSARFARVKGAVRGVGDRTVRVELRGLAGNAVQSAGPGGSFRFSKLAPGEYALCVALASDPCKEERRREFTVEAGDDIDLELRAPE